MTHRTVYKTTTAEFLDDFYRGETRPRQEAFEDALALMAQSTPLSDAARDLEHRSERPLEKGSAAAFESEWLAGKHGDQPVDRVLRHGYRMAVELARKRDVPIDNFWVTGAGDDVEVHICESTDRVTVLVFVPNEEQRPYGSERAASNSWVVRLGDVDVRDDAPRTTLDDGAQPVMATQVSGKLPRSAK
jgi:hypothetical protein